MVSTCPIAKSVAHFTDVPREISREIDISTFFRADINKNDTILVYLRKYVD